MDSLKYVTLLLSNISILVAGLFYALSAIAKETDILSPTTGNTTSGSGTITLPSTTFQKGVRVASKGDLVFIKSGAGNKVISILSKAALPSSRLIALSSWHFEPPVENLQNVI
jgi:hypothetical protein